MQDNGHHALKALQLRVSNEHLNLSTSPLEAATRCLKYINARSSNNNGNFESLWIAYTTP